ncbi:MAG: hypothetical protein ACLFSG_09605 [Halothiobacillaceae bacterium]
MSLDALRSALGMARPENFGPKHKAVLLSLADHANAAGEAFVCRQQIIDETWFDRKAVSGAISDLKEAGLIIDTGRRRGRTGQVIVWHLPWIEHRHEQARKRAGLGAPDYADAGAGGNPDKEQQVRPSLPGQKQAPKGNSSENGPVTQRGPNPDGKRPESGRKEAPIRATEPPTGFNPLPGVNPLPEGGSAQARAPARETAKPEQRQPGQKRTARKRLVPEDFSPRQADLEWAVAKVPIIAKAPGQLAHETERFVNHHRAEGNRFADAYRAWRNWLLKAAEFAHRDGANKPGGLAHRPRYLD